MLTCAKKKKKEEIRGLDSISGQSCSTNKAAKDDLLYACQTLFQMNNELLLHHSLSMHLDVVDMFFHRRIKKMKRRGFQAGGPRGGRRAKVNDIFMGSFANWDGN